MTSDLTPATRIRQDAAAWLNHAATPLAWLSTTSYAWTVLRPTLAGCAWTVRRDRSTLNVTAGPITLRWTPAYPLPDDPADLIRLALALLAYGHPGDGARPSWLRTG